VERASARKQSPASMASMRVPTSCAESVWECNDLAYLWAIFFRRAAKILQHCYATRSEKSKVKATRREKASWERCISWLKFSVRLKKDCGDRGLGWIYRKRSLHCGTNHRPFADINELRVVRMLRAPLCHTLLAVLVITSPFFHSRALNAKRAAPTTPRQTHARIRFGTSEIQIQVAKIE
jgi:hypothetical protein